MENHVQQQRVGGCNDQRVPAGTLDSQPFFSSDSEGPYFALRVCWMIILLGCASAGPTQTSGTHNLNGPRPQSLFDFYPKWTLCGDKNKKKVQTRPLTHLKGSMQCDEIERRRSELCIIALIFTFILCEGGLGLDPPEQTIENVYVLVSSASPCLPSQVEKKDVRENVLAAV